MGLVKSAKKNVNCPDVDSYAMLDACATDSDDAVSRLPYQDTFHEVKSKLETRNENEEFSGMKSWGSNSTSNRGRKIMAYWSSGRSGSSQIVSSDAELLRASCASSSVRKEIGGAFPPTSINSARGSYSIHSERNRPSAEESSFSSSSQRHYGKLSMADFMKSGKLQSKSPPFTSSEDYINFLASRDLVPGLGGVSNENVKSMEDSSILPQENVKSTIPAEIRVLDHGENYNSEPNLKSHFKVDILNNASYFEDNAYNDCPDCLQRSFGHQEENDLVLNLLLPEHPISSHAGDANMFVSSVAVDSQRLCLRKEEVELRESALNALESCGCNA